MKTLNKALFEIQKELGLTLTKDAKNPYYKSSYLSLPALSEAVQPLFIKYGLLLQQPVASIGELTYIKTRITHVESGEFQEELALVTVSKAGDPQALGSGITYMRRFALGAMLGLAADDDDGNAASNKKAAPAVVSPLVAASNTITTTPAAVAISTPTASEVLKAAAAGTTAVPAAKSRTTFRKPSSGKAAAAEVKSNGASATADEGWN